jgi:TRAP-type C4-dicarboxylate transport system permease small subunit
MNILKKINANIDSVLRVFMMVALSIMVTLIFAQILFRYVFMSSLSFSEELARYFFIWMTFLGSSVAIREKSHLKVTMFVDFLKSEKVKRNIHTIADLCSLGFLAVLAVFGFEAAHKILSFGQTSPTMEFLEIGFVYYIIPIASVFMIGNLIEDIHFSLTKR